MGEFVNPVKQIGREGAGNFGKHHTDSLCPLVDETAGDSIWLVPKLFDCLIHLLLRFVRVAGQVIQHTGHGGNGYICFLGDIFDRRIHKAVPQFSVSFGFKE
ncbi:hypothetical protein D3C75_976210 [compost metagenome]